MIALGVLAMGFFLSVLLDPDFKQNSILYFLLLSTIIFMCLKILHEWVHYFYITIPETPPAEKKFTADIFTTYYPGEPYKMVETTLLAIQQIRYPHTTYLCDEANDPRLRDLCKQLNIHHITRPDKKDAKAGNINNALKQSTGELCVVLDPDHTPFPEFLDPIVTHFNDPEVGFVQIVQAYINYNESLIAKGAAQQTFQLYGPMMMTMNRYGTVPAIGANCTFRRGALDSIGGHATGLAEDLHTAMKLHARGWKSVYVPKVLSRGLVPSTLAAYYKQQQKWSRGVFELWITAYPKLFNHFTWRQKIHYGIIPLYYLSGIISLINFLIPVISLVLGVSPIKLDFPDFALNGLPLFMAIILIRHYVQRWVMEEDERGFHIVGGLLFIGTWWVFVKGLLYTIIRKKIPYIPTPKDNSDNRNFDLNIPNITVLIISVLAVVYGLSTDLNPYSLTMAGFACINCMIMLFTIMASGQLRFRLMKTRYPLIYILMRFVSASKKGFWLFRHRLYSRLRISGLLLLLCTLGFVLYTTLFEPPKRDHPYYPNAKKDIFLLGMYAPEQKGGISSIRKIKNLGKTHNLRFGIISVYLPWGDGPGSTLPFQTLDSIYQSGAIPMITWEPWQSLFKHSLGKNPEDKEKKIFSRIVNGDYDRFLAGFCEQFRSLQRPLFLRFAQEADNPVYPWSATGDNSPAEFKSAWKYLHDFFEERKIYNIIWVWNPWKAEGVDAYFPGKDYVDWIGVTCLNYGKMNPDAKFYSMDSLYQPFHLKTVFRTGLPVILSEMGSPKSEGNQQQWFQKAFDSSLKHFPEIKALVLFNSPGDKNDPMLPPFGHIDWDINLSDSLSALISQKSKMADDIQNTFPLSIPLIRSNVSSDNKTMLLFKDIRGVNYTRGQNWSNNYHIFTKKELKDDFSEMKMAGINTIKYYGPGIYDYNILNTAKEFQLNIQYCFWIPDQINFIHNKSDLEKLNRNIINTIRHLKNKREIIAWHIGNTTFQNLETSYFKPELLYQQEAYLSWLEKLIKSIKEIDSLRPVTVDIIANAGLLTSVDKIRFRVPAISGFGLIIDRNDTSLALIKQLSSPWFFSKISPEIFLQNASNLQGGFIENWKDEETSDFVKLNGLVDMKGRWKPAFIGLRSKWTGIQTVELIPGIKILRPAVTILANDTPHYNAIVYEKNSWRLASNDSANLKFDWYLVEKDRFNNPISMKYMGNGTQIPILIPQNPYKYQVYLSAIKDNQIRMVNTSLNIPLNAESRK
jgi:cellulose synthase (UDP-forming)